METLIKRRLASAQDLCANLAKFSTDAAIFYQKAPDDSQWTSRRYPQIIFTVDRFSDPQKGVAGLVTVDVISAQDCTPPEEIEQLIRSRLEGVFFKPPDGETSLLKWQRSEVFTEPASERTPLIIGTTSQFELYEFPLVETSEPDPIQSLNAWAQNLDALIIGVDDFGEFFEPSREHPALYFDVKKIRLGEQLPSVTWVDATINLHLFAPDTRSRREWLAFLNNAILIRGEIPMTDGGVLYLQDAEYLWTANEIDGQIQYKFRYGIERKIPYEHPLMKVADSFDSTLRWRDSDVHS